MYQIKVTASERKILIAISSGSKYIRSGDWRRTNCSVIENNTVLFEFRADTLSGLIRKGLVDDSNKITKLGVEAAIKGYYEHDLPF